jgi:nitrite reductase/ring-hydroxylating ferredoxin subunit
MTRHVVARVGEIAPGGRKIFTVAGRTVGVFHVNGEYHALLNRCPHQGAPLCEGMLVSLVESSGPGEYRTVRQGEMLRCPWHGWEFDIRTGQSWCDPSKLRVKTYPVSVESGEGFVSGESSGSEESFVKGPYVAEKYEVSVQDEYVVVEI